MNLNTIIELWVLVGVVYVVINGYIRKMYQEDDSLLVFAHMTMGPMFVAVLIGVNIAKGFKRLFKHESTPNNNS